MNTILAFNRDGTLAPFGGVIDKDALLKARAKGYKLATGGGASSEEQKRQWMEHFGIEPDITASKGEIIHIFSERDTVILVDDNPPETAEGRGIQCMRPQEFLDWLEKERA